MVQKFDCNNFVYRYTYNDNSILLFILQHFDCIMITQQCLIYVRQQQ